jgi:hypothetical protein
MIAERDAILNARCAGLVDTDTIQGSRTPVLRGCFRNKLNIKVKFRICRRSGQCVGERSCAGRTRFATNQSHDCGVKNFCDGVDNGRSRGNHWAEALAATLTFWPSPD